MKETLSCTSFWARRRSEMPPLEAEVTTTASVHDTKIFGNLVLGFPRSMNKALILADKGYDSEERNYEIAKQRKSSALIPLKRRNTKTGKHVDWNFLRHNQAKKPRTKAWRRIFRKRVAVERTFSRTFETFKNINEVRVKGLSSVNETYVFTALTIMLLFAIEKIREEDKENICKITNTLR